MMVRVYLKGIRSGLEIMAPGLCCFYNGQHFLIVNRIVALKRQQSVWVAAPSDEVHSTQELLEVWQDSQGMGRVGETRESSGVQSLQD